MLKICCDYMIAGLDNPFDGEVESVGAIEREDPPLRGCTMEELVEGVPRRVEHTLGRDGHAMPCSPRVCQARAGKLIECLIDRLGLGKTGGGVVEVDHFALTSHVLRIQRPSLGDVIGTLDDR